MLPVDSDVVILVKGDDPVVLDGKHVHAVVSVIFTVDGGGAFLPYCSRMLSVDDEVRDVELEIDQKRVVGAKKGFGFFPPTELHPAQKTHPDIVGHRGDHAGGIAGEICVVQTIHRCAGTRLQVVLDVGHLSSSRPHRIL